jgi:hypothetical protein
MSAITWTRHEFTPIADAAEREAWYTSAGLNSWFDITVTEGTTSSDYDTFVFKPYANDGAYYELLWQYMMGGTSSSLVPTLYQTYYYPPSSSSRSTAAIRKIKESTTDGKVSFDFATIGDTEILRICTTNVTWGNTIFFVKTKGESVDDNSVSNLFVVASPCTDTATLAGELCILSDAKAAVKRLSNTSAGVQLYTDNRGLCNKYILRNIVVLGVQTPLYSIDGSPDYAPGGNIEFMIDGNSYFSLGHGVCLKIS